MIILLQSVTIQFRRIFDIFCITKCGKVILLQSVIDCYYKGRQVLQSVTNYYYKVRQVLQSVTDLITKYVRYYKVCQLLPSETYHAYKTADIYI